MGECGGEEGKRNQQVRRMARDVISRNRDRDYRSLSTPPRDELLRNGDGSMWAIEGATKGAHFPPTCSAMVLMGQNGSLPYSRYHTMVICDG